MALNRFLSFPVLSMACFVYVCLALVQSNHAHAAPFSSMWMKIKTQQSLVQRIVGMQVSDQSASNATFTDDPLAGGWTMRYDNNIVMIPMDDLIIPVQVKKPEVVLTHKDRGRFAFSDGKMRSVTRTPVLAATSRTATYAVRPTLFISLPGFNKNPEVQDWQHNMEALIAPIANPSNPRHSQYMHFEVNWDSDESNRNQVEDLGEVVKDFLDKRAYEWDVVIVGHSRGGIFAHELTRKIVGHRNMKNLHTFLLDPTSPSVIGDQYPMYKHHARPTHHYGSLYFDGKPFAWSGKASLGLPLSTVGDQSITGYDNYGSIDFLFGGTDHTNIPTDWLANKNNQGFARALNNIWSRKDLGSFLSDGISGAEVVKIRQKDIGTDGEIRFDGSNLTMFGTINVGPAQASINAMVGKDGIEIATAVFVTSAQLSIRHDHAAISANIAVANASASISKDGLNSHVDVLGQASTGLHIGSGEVELSTNLGGKNGVSTEIGTGGISISVGGVDVIKSAEGAVGHAAGVVEGGVNHAADVISNCCKIKIGW